MSFKKGANSEARLGSLGREHTFIWTPLGFIPYPPQYDIAIYISVYLPEQFQVMKGKPWWSLSYREVGSVCSLLWLGSSLPLSSEFPLNPRKGLDFYIQIEA